MIIKAIGIVFTLYIMHKLCLWLERRGWLYYLNRKPESGTLGSTLQELNAFLSPSVRHTIEVKQNEVRVEQKAHGLQPFHTK